MIDERVRCGWVSDSLLYIRYHDEEWGVPVHDERKLFEFLTLEGAQAGLSWYTILRKREAYREAFAGFDPEIVAHYDERKLEELMQNAGIVRNRLKLGAAIRNAAAFLKVREAFGSFDAYIWRFVDGKPVRNRWEALKDVPVSTPISDKLSKDLKQRGFSFVGSTICYAHMQATGMVQDHLTCCFRHEEIASRY